MTEEAPRALLRASVRPLVALVVFLSMAVAHTWPLARNPAHLSRNDAADAQLNTWAIAWVAHQLPRHPTHLFDANIFAPERLTLAYSEAMIVQGVMAMPVRAAGGSPVLAYNLVLIAGFALTGWAFCLLTQHWTGSWIAGYVSGSLAAFNAHVLVRLTHLQTQHVEFIALILFALDRVFTTRRVRDAVLLGVGFALQGLTSVYLLVFTTWMLIFAVLGRVRDWRPVRRTSALLVTAAAVGIGLMAPYLFAYYEAHRLNGFERTIDDARRYAGSWTDFLTTGSRMHFTWWSHTYFDVSRSATFPGFVAATLVCLALVWTETRRDKRVRMCLAAALGCVLVLSLPSTPFYPFLHEVIPLFRLVRVQAHIGQIVLLMVAVLAGFGVAGLAQRCADARVQIAVGLTACALVNVEALRAPLDYTPFTEIPPIYRSLIDEPGAVVIELPAYEPRYSFQNATYMLNSTLHWRPILNGYSGFTPDSYRSTFEAVQTFPDVTSLLDLHARGVTHVVVHAPEFRAIYGADRYESIRRTEALQPLATSEDIQIYRLR